MEEFREIIRGVPNEMLNSFLAIYLDLLSQVPQRSPAYNTFTNMVMCIKDELERRGMNVKGGHASEAMKREAINYLTSHGVNVGQNYKVEDNSSSVTEGILGFGIFLAVIIAIVIIKGLFDIVVNLWNSGILKVILGLALIGGGIYLGYKEGLFERIKNMIKEHKQNNNGKNKENHNSKNKEKVKEIGGKVASFVKNLTIYSSTAIVLTTGIAHLEKHTNVFEGPVLEDIGDSCRLVYEFAGRFVREKAYELTNDYSEFENNGYMNYIDPNNINNWNNIDYEEKDCYLVLNDNYTWETLSHYCYGNPYFAEHLKLYNSHYVLDDEVLHPGDAVFIPNTEKLEEYIYGKRLTKKR